MQEQQELFSLPGIANQIESLQKQLDTPSNTFDHILIHGPRGVGKSLFVQFAINHFWWRHEKSIINERIISIDCQGITDDELLQMETLPLTPQRLIILENFESYPHEKFQTLKSLLKKVKVVATTKELPPDDFIDDFLITIEVPPLMRRRDDILHFVAQKYPSLNITNAQLLCLYAYHWPGNLRQLNKAIHRLFVDNRLPPEITKQVPEEKLKDIFIRLLKNGLLPTALGTTHATCFSSLVPTCDGMMLFTDSIKIEFNKNDQSCGVKAIVGEYFLDAVLDGIEVRWLVKCFFELIYGRGVLLRDQNIFDLQPFNKESLKIINQGLKDISKWRVGDTYSFDYDFCHEFFQFFSKDLTQEEIDAASTYLNHCKSLCPDLPKSGLIDNSISRRTENVNQQYKLGYNLAHLEELAADQNSYLEATYTAIKREEEQCESTSLSRENSNREQVTPRQQNKQHPQIGIANNQPSTHLNKGGHPVAPLTEAVFWAYNELGKSGNKEIIRPGKIQHFIQYLKECITEGNRNESAYVAERIKSISKPGGKWKITMTTLTNKQILSLSTTGKHETFNQANVSTILTRLRQEKINIS